ncbi:MAG TPA: FISUMP domain-containing protein [Chitinophagales bacterium]|nr:FISUMP domain-containing protein [Chitinophagales bacterium]
MKKALCYLIVSSVAVFYLSSCSKDGGQSSTVVTDIDGNVYKTVQIGTQTWMMRSLRVTKYADGTPLKNGLHAGNIGVSGDTLHYFFYYNNDTAYLYDYGYFYTWSAVMRGKQSSSASPSGIQGPCPNGWHVPSEAEWQTLVDYLGGNLSAGGYMKGYSYWQGGNSGEGGGNESGFNGLPSGYRTAAGPGAARTAGAFFWSTNEQDNTSAFIRELFNTSTAVGDSAFVKNTGASCRCLQD